MLVIESRDAHHVIIIFNSNNRKFGSVGPLQQDFELVWPNLLAYEINLALKGSRKDPCILIEELNGKHPKSMLELSN